MEQDQEQQLTAQLTVDTEHNLYPPTSSLQAQAQESRRISPHVQKFIQGVLKQDVEEVFKLPLLQPPDVPDDLPLADYFVSSSHNTYLLSGQLLGKASPLSYKHVLANGARCVEIDVWPSKNGPIVTHGHTFSQTIPFIDTCIAIGNSTTPTSWPILVSLECHVYGEEPQNELVRIMRETWGSKLIEGKIDGVDDKDGLKPKDVWGKILVMVEYYPPPALQGLRSDDDFSSSSSSSESEGEDGGSGLWPKRKTIPKDLRITPTLASMGYYLRSMKPHTNWFSQLFEDPPHILLNISESHLLTILTSSKNNNKTILQTLITHSQSHIRRIYPKGTRISSSNLRPYTFWGTGSHVVAVNWQKYDTGMQVNEAMFVGTNGWVAKPTWMRGKFEGEGESKDRHHRSLFRLLRNEDEKDEDKDERKVKVKVEVVGVSSAPPPSDRTRTPTSKPYNAYLRGQLFLPTTTSIPPPSLSSLTSVFNSIKIQTKAKLSNEIDWTTNAKKVICVEGDIDFAYPDPDPELDPELDSAEKDVWEKGKALWGRKNRSGSSKDDDDDDDSQSDHGGELLEKVCWEWEVYEKWEELLFFKFSVCEDEFGKDDRLAIFCARLADIRRSIITNSGGGKGKKKVSGWRAVRLMDLKGKDSGASVLARFTFEI